SSFPPPPLSSFPTRRSSDLPVREQLFHFLHGRVVELVRIEELVDASLVGHAPAFDPVAQIKAAVGSEVAIDRQDRPDELLALDRSEEHTSELQSRGHLVCRL